MKTKGNYAPALGRRMRYAPALAALSLLAACSAAHRDRVEVSGLLEGIVVEAGTLAGGRVAEVLVREGDRVERGAVMVRLESEEAEAMVAAAEAQLAQAEAALAKLEAGARPEQIRQAEAAVAKAEQTYQIALTGSRSQEIDAARAAEQAARAQRDEARSEFERVQRLHETRVVSQQVFDRAKHALEAATAQHRAAAERLDLVAEGARSEEVLIAKANLDQVTAMLDELRNGARIEDIDAARAMRDAAAANLRLARQRARETQVPAPRDGIVESVDVRPGDLVKPGPVVRVIDPNDLELVVFVSPQLMGRVLLGSRLPFTTDAFGDETFEGEVIFIANEGEFTPRNLQTQEARARQVFGIKLRADSAGGRLKAGMTATVHFDSLQARPS